jgi:formate dehydrogenase gamma subunit
MSEEMDSMQADLLIPPRFTAAQRIEHAFLAVSFTVLGYTGLIQKFAANPFADRLIGWLGGIESTRVVHRWSAAVFAFLTVYHVIVLAYKMIVRRVDMTMLPVLKDATDALHLTRYNLLLTREPPQMPRYNFTEKLEYWALIWGGVIMMVTGFMLWNPLITSSFLPGQFIPAAKAAHGGEAILAVLAILVWHFYNVHIKEFNKSMFTGKFTRHQMEQEHGSELSRLIAGEARPAPTPREIWRRMILFVPVAIAVAATGVGTIYWAATAETTAVSTLPPMPHPKVSGPETASTLPAARPSVVSAPLIPHPVASRKQCNQCHGFSGMKPAPADHEGRPVGSCQICHRPAPLPKAEEAGAEAATSGKPGPIPHSIQEDVYKDCTQCHAAGKIKPNPANHAAFTVGSCTACHRPSAAPQGASSGAGKKSDGIPGLIPHSIEEDVYKDCTQCHAAGKIMPNPANHAGFDMGTCTACHKRASSGTGN